MIVPNDFVGKWAISQGYDDNKLQQYIDYYKPRILAQLLGVELLTEYNADPTTARFVKITNALMFSSEGCDRNDIYYSDGIKNMLLNIITAHYYKEDLGISTSGGKIKPQSSGGSLVNDNYTSAFVLYNNGITSYKTIQKYIKDNITDYPEYKGIHKQTTWLI